MYPILKWLLPVLIANWNICYALDSDKNQKLNIISDGGTYNFKTGVDIYEGHVKADQGSTHVIADRLITKKNKENKIQEVTAYGLQTLAHYWTLPKKGDNEIHAWAKIIKFYPLESNASLEHEVKVVQGENQFQGELIHYNGNAQTITVPATAHAHASLVYNPEN